MCKAFAADLFAHTRCTSHTTTHFHSAVLFKSELVVFVFLFRNVSLIAFKDLWVYGVRVELYGQTSGGGQIHGLRVP